MKMKTVTSFVLVLVAAFTLSAALETKDVITRRAYENLIKSGAIQGITMTKTIISNSILEEAMVAHFNRKLGGGTIFDCGETCFLGKCYTKGCACGEYKFCYGENSLSDSSNNKAVLTGLPVVPTAFSPLETKDVITHKAYEDLVSSGAIQGITMTKTIISNPILEEALVAHFNRKLGGGTIFDCGETCFLGKCYTKGCACGEYKFCYGENSLSDSSNNKAVLTGLPVVPTAFSPLETKDVITHKAYEDLVSSGAIQGITMTKTIISNPILEEALVAHFNRKLGGGTIFDCGETCFLGKCYTKGCACGEYKFCYGENSLSDSNNNKAVLTGLPVVPTTFSPLETKDVITRKAYEDLVSSGAIQGITMTKTIISNPILEEALVAHFNRKLGGGTIFDCGETCFLGTCYTKGCACGEYKFCYGENYLAI